MARELSNSLSTNCRLRIHDLGETPDYFQEDAVETIWSRLVLPDSVSNVIQMTRRRMDLSVYQVTHRCVELSVYKIRQANCRIG